MKYIPVRLIFIILITYIRIIQTHSILLRIWNFGFVSLKVYDMPGKEIVTLVNDKLSPGTYRYEFGGSNLSS